MQRTRPDPYSALRYFREEGREKPQVLDSWDGSDYRNKHFLSISWVSGTVLPNMHRSSYSGLSPTQNRGVYYSVYR